MATRIANWICLPFVLLLVAPVGKARDRSEVDRRLEILERLWDQSTNQQARQLTSKNADSLPFLMLTGQYGKAAQTIDAAISEFRKDMPGEPIPAWFESLELKVSKSLIDPGVESIRGTIRHSYTAGTSAPRDSRLRIRLVVDGKEMPPISIPVPMDSSCFELVAPARMATALVWCEPENAGPTCSPANMPQQRILLIPKLDGLKKDLLARKKSVLSLPDSIGKQTWLHRSEGLAALESTGKWTLTRDPLKDLADMIHTPLGKIRNGAWPEPAPGADQVLVLPLAKGNKTVRVRLPLRDTADSGAFPAVVALHGAGDDENRWIDGYNRQFSRHCLQRGWVMICPKDGLEPDLLTAVAGWSGLKINRIAVMGHSQGGSQALAFGAQHPAELQGIAVLGASGRVGDGKAYRKIPLFVGIGTEDFAFRACEMMLAQMRDQGQQKLTHHQHKKIGHVLIPIAARAELLEFLDEVLAVAKQ